MNQAHTVQKFYLVLHCHFLGSACSDCPLLCRADLDFQVAHFCLELMDFGFTVRLLANSFLVFIDQLFFTCPVPNMGSA